LNDFFFFCHENEFLSAKYIFFNLLPTKYVFLSVYSLTPLNLPVIYHVLWVRFAISQQGMHFLLLYTTGFWSTLLPNDNEHYMMNPTQ
jgi:hypothetical protein